MVAVTRVLPETFTVWPGDGKTGVPFSGLLAVMQSVEVVVSTFFVVQTPAPGGGAPSPVTVSSTVSMSKLLPATAWPWVKRIASESPLAAAVYCTVGNCCQPAVVVRQFWA